ncbi:MAG: tetrahydrofolate dehydrogenase/cyclohydrolase catalytic domain-containing protein [Patescibacteria group bacterium]
MSFVGQSRVNTNATVFDGFAKSAQLEQDLLSRVQALDKDGHKIKIAAILFDEDTGSQLYSGLKQQAATRLGIEYDLFHYSLLDDPAQVAQKISSISSQPEVIGLIVQKPWRQTWAKVLNKSDSLDLAAEYQTWWYSLVSRIDPNKDVDGLHPSTLAAIQDGTWWQRGRVLPATCKAVVTILQDAGVMERGLMPATRMSGEEQNLVAKESGLFLKSHDFSSNFGPNKITILGKSDLLGQPLFYLLSWLGFNVEMIGSKELNERIEQKIYLHDSAVIVSATGRSGLITEEMVSEGVVLVDVGEPRADIDFAGCLKKARFITPVPGGVGPMTVISLMENGVELAEGQPSRTNLD